MERYKKVSWGGAVNFFVIEHIFFERHFLCDRGSFTLWSIFKSPKPSFSFFKFSERRLSFRKAACCFSFKPRIIIVNQIVLYDRLLSKIFLFFEDFQINCKLWGVFWLKVEWHLVKWFIALGHRFIATFTSSLPILWFLGHWLKIDLKSNSSFSLKYLDIYLESKKK